MTHPSLAPAPARSGAPSRGPAPAADREVRPAAGRGPDLPVDRRRAPRALPRTAGRPALPGGAAEPGAGRPAALQDNLLLDHDDRYLHYRSPTESGRSGSRVFNDHWELIGIHQAGGFDLPRLNGQGGTHSANEGVTLPAIRARLAERLQHRALILQHQSFFDFAVLGTAKNNDSGTDLDFHWAAGACLIYGFTSLIMDFRASASDVTDLS
jgi:hypothetical protein